MINTLRVIARRGLRIPVQRTFSTNEVQELTQEEKAAMKNPIPQQLGPYLVENLEADVRYSWCSCGLSKKDVILPNNHYIAIL